MKKFLCILGFALMSSAYAANDTQEATPLNNSKSQAHGEDHKKARPTTGVRPVRDGSTARGEGSGIATTNRAEDRGRSAAAAREARPHKETTQGGTPK